MMLRHVAGRLLAAGLLLLLWHGGKAVHAQGSPLDSLIRAHVHTFEMRDGRLSGPGAELLRSAARGAQFVTLGDDHNTRVIPEFTVSLFRMLHEEYGFDYLALEEGPALGRLLSQRARADAPDGAFRLALEYPNAFHFYNEEYVRMIDRIAAISRASSDPVWGLNQEFGVAHVVARLVELAPDSTARALAGELLRRALEYEGERFARNESFIMHGVGGDDFDALRQAFRPAPGSEAEHLIAQTRLSHEMYKPYGMTPRPHFSAFYESAARRERNMKTLFTERYRAAQAAGDELPRVLVKSGHFHTMRGFGRSHESLSLGNFLNEVATFNGAHELNLWLHPYREYFAAQYPDLVPLVQPGAHTLFDLRPIRAWAAFNRIAEMTPELRRLLIGSDMLIILGDPAPGTLDALRTPNFHWYPGSSGL